MFDLGDALEPAEKQLNAPRTLHPKKQPLSAV
jgi:hypothetical protein